jgi:hypothetical protein
MVSDKLTTMLVLSSQDFQQRVPRFHRTFCSDPKTRSLNSLQPGSDAADRAHWSVVLPTIHLNQQPAVRQIDCTKPTSIAVHLFIRGSLALIHSAARLKYNPRKRELVISHTRIAVTLMGF